tara:strand:- start:25 stop:222 length:198 start_codon:yes stop_codon:yes gene_type:complete
MKNFKAGDLVRYLFQDAAEDAEGIGIVVKDDPSGWFWIYAGEETKGMKLWPPEFLEPADNNEVRS